MGLSVSRSDVGETSVTIHCKGSFTFSSGMKDISYKATVEGVSASSNNNEISITITNLQKGTEYSFSGSMVLSYRYPIGTSENGETMYMNGSQTNDLGSVTVYTHPGAWSWGAVQGSTIANCITADNDAAWRTHFQKAYHWYKQNDTDYTFITIPASGNAISADWYNERATAKEAISSIEISRVTGGNNGTLITAAKINELNFVGI